MSTAAPRVVPDVPKPVPRAVLVVTFTAGAFVAIITYRTVRWWKQCRTGR